MADLSRDDVLKLAQLARLDVSDAEADSFVPELSAILGYVEQLQNVDIADLMPTNQVTGLQNVMRDDTPIDYGYEPSDLLANAPKTEKQMLKVKRMIG